jgi:hypothetical protein
MFWVFLALAYVTIVIAWVFGQALSGLERWSNEHPNLQLASDIEMDPAKQPNQLDVGALGLVFAMVLLVLLFVPGPVTSNGQSVSPNEIPDRLRRVTAAGRPVAYRVPAARRRYPPQIFLTYRYPVVAPSPPYLTRRRCLNSDTHKR